MSYFGNIKRGIKTTAKGMSLTLKHLVDARFSRAEKQIADDDFFELDKGHVTIQYPHQTIEIPDHGRNQLDCEIDDCIVCDKCAKICPVDCIEIEAIKSPELIRKTSDGSPVRLHAAKFDIDMAKCCFCGLCTTVCPTECLTMNSEYDYSVLDVTQLNFAFSNLSEEVAQEKRELYDQFVIEKEALKAEKLKEAKPKPTMPSPVFRPGMKSTAKTSDATQNKPVFKSKPVFKPEKKNLDTDAASAPKPDFTPGLKPTLKSGVDKPAPRPIFKPNQKPADKTVTDADKALKPTKTSADEPEKKGFTPGIKAASKSGGDKPALPRPVYKPSQKPTDKIASKPAKASKSINTSVDEPKKQGFTPGMKPAVEENADKPASRPVYKPSQKPTDKTGSEGLKTLKPTQKSAVDQEKPEVEKPKSPPSGFKPSMKPKKD
ncbi:MAG: formate hydrogenlyase subunit 6/NADH:ubiquinone oxidoreductase subunit I [Arcticibacterium sp.]|jgi:formate hydrogenlyase subunit 6/NADH:ubiquinone oxidoreductase subunit I